MFNKRNHKLTLNIFFSILHSAMASKSAHSETLKGTATAMGVTVPKEFLCPLTKEIMINPLMTKYNINFEREAIISWLQSEDGTCPVTKKLLYLSDLIPNKALEAKIAFWKWDNMLPDPEEYSINLLERSSSSLVIGIVSPKKKKFEKAFYRQMAAKMAKCL